jgi:hypothetical protein
VRVNLLTECVVAALWLLELPVKNDKTIKVPHNITIAVYC